MYFSHKADADFFLLKENSEMQVIFWFIPPLKKLNISFHTRITIFCLLLCIYYNHEKHYFSKHFIPLSLLTDVDLGKNKRILMERSSGKKLSLIPISSAIFNVFRKENHPKVFETDN